MCVLHVGVIPYIQSDKGRVEAPCSKHEATRMATNTVRIKTASKLTDYVGKFEVISVPNITNICYGRDVGYKIEEIVLPKQIQEISATKIRQQERNEKRS